MSEALFVSSNAARMRVLMLCEEIPEISVIEDNMNFDLGRFDPRIGRCVVFVSKKMLG